MITDVWLYFFVALFSVPGSEICEDHSQICPEIYNPVCGSYPCYADEYCTKTYPNSCFACSDKKVIAYRPGDCASPGGPHQTNPGNTNDFVDEPICKFFLVDDRGVRTEDLENNENVDHMPIFFYIPGKCKNMNDHVCQESDREKICSTTSDQVCAYNYFTNNGKIYPAKVSSVTKENACLACKDPSISFYVEGACEGSDPPGNSGSKKATKSNTTKTKKFISKSRKTK